MLFEEFKRFREEQPDAAAFLVTAGDRYLEITWKQFTDDIDAIAYIIRKHAPGEKIAILGENSYEWVVGHVSVIFSGSTIVPMDVNLTAEEISERLKFVGISVLAHSSLYAEKAKAAAKLTPGVRLAAFGTWKTELFIKSARAAVKANRQASVWNRRDFDPEATSMIVFTSGTTSKPRGAELTIAGIEAFSESAKMVLDMQVGQRSLMLLPLHHIFGICTTYMMLARGVALGVCPDFRRIYDVVERFRANFIFLVPALAEILAQKIELHGNSAEAAFGFPIDWILTGGAALPRRTYEHLTALGIRMLTGYGITETTALYSIAPSLGDPHVGSAGKVSQLPTIGTRVSADGELLIRGSAVMKGYFRNPEATARAIDADGWYHTGDIGTIDADGFVWITGRASRTIILSSGKKIAPEELEEKLLAIPGIREAVVSGEGETREVKAEVFAVISEEMLKRAIGQLNLQLPVYKRINRIVVRTEPFPRTSSGKIKVS